MVAEEGDRLSEVTIANGDYACLLFGSSEGHKRVEGSPHLEEANQMLVFTLEEDVGTIEFRVFKGLLEGCGEVESAFLLVLVSFSDALDGYH